MSVLRVGRFHIFQNHFKTQGSRNRSRFRPRIDSTNGIGSILDEFIFMIFIFVCGMTKFEVRKPNLMGFGTNSTGGADSGLEFAPIMPGVRLMLGQNPLRSRFHSQDQPTFSGFCLRRSSCLHLGLAQESGSRFDACAGCLAQAAYSVQAFDWSGGKCRGKDRGSTQDIPSLFVL